MLELLTKEQILQADDRPIEEIEVDGWGGKVRVRGLTGTERDQYESSLLKASKQGDYRGVRARLVALSVVDTDGNRMFSFEEAERLSEKSAVALDKVFWVAQRLSGLRQKDIEELTADLADRQSVGSISD